MPEVKCLVNYPLLCKGLIVIGKKLRTLWVQRQSFRFEDVDSYLYFFSIFSCFNFIEMIAAMYLGSQIRSHAQKYFLKVQKNGTLAHVPPPRPKRKAAHPYPQKASKNGQSSP